MAICSLALLQLIIIPAVTSLMISVKLLSEMSKSADVPHIYGRWRYIFRIDDISLYAAKCSRIVAVVCSQSLHSLRTKGIPLASISLPSQYHANNNVHFIFIGWYLAPFMMVETILIFASLITHAISLQLSNSSCFRINISISNFLWRISPAFSLDFAVFKLWLLSSPSNMCRFAHTGYFDVDDFRGFIKYTTYAASPLI